MTVRHSRHRLYYFTIEDESILPEAFGSFEQDVFAITYKLSGTEDVFVTTHETKQAMDRHDVPYNLLAEEDASRISVLHSPLSREELGDNEDVVKALALAYRAIALACVGINGDVDLGFDPEEGARSYSYFTAPSGHTFIWRLFTTREEAKEFVASRPVGDEDAGEWAESIPLESADELASYH